MIPSYYFNPRALNKNRSKYFKMDLENLLTEFINITKDKNNGPSFIVYKEAWRNLKFSMIHHSIKKSENISEYYQTLYGAALSFVMMDDLKEANEISNCNFKNIFSLFTIYTIFYTMPNIKIPCNITLG